jgi:Fur family ferric uptake transcriptional regulator
MGAAMKTTKQQLDRDSFRDLIRQAGLRSTHARVAILERLTATGGPMTHARIADELASQGIDRVTIYRSLIEMAEAGLLTRMELGDRVWRYELRRSGHAEDATHLHFLCVDCGKIDCLDGTSVAKALAPAIRRAANGTISEVLLKGHCRQCE